MRPAPDTKRSVLVCSPTLPEFDRERGLKRIWDVLQFFREADWRVALLTETTRGEPRYLELIRDRGIEIQQGMERAPDALQSTQPDLALLCFWKTALRLLPLIRKARPSTRIIVDTLDLHFLREFRGAFRSEGLLDPERCFDLQRELNAYAAADQVWTVSDKESALLSDLVGNRDLACCVPDCEEASLAPAPLSERRGMIFIGNFRHPPNRAAVHWLLNEILPCLDPRLLEAHPLSVVGHHLPEEIAREGRSHQHVRMVGWVPELEPLLLSSRISLAPLTYGAGTKGKILQSLICGTPVVSTWIGLEGLELTPERHALLANEAAAFADAVERLLTDSSLWERLAVQGRRQILKHHSREAVRKRFHQALAEALRRTAKPAGLALRASRTQSHWLKQQYQLLLERLRHAVSRHTPEQARLLIVTKGDADLLQHDGRIARHFPSDEEGRYLGYHPPDSRWCLDALETCRREGYSHFVLPAPYAWWLEYYRELAAHLKTVGRTAFQQQDTGRIYVLPTTDPPEKGS